ncbi:WD40 repeat domain-containing protein [Bacteroidota bacterium]
MRLIKLKILVLVFISFFEQLNLYAQKDEALIISLKTHSDQVHSIAFSPDGNQFISGSKDETIIIWDFVTFQPITSLKRHYATVYELEYTADGEYFFSGGDKTINMWKKRWNIC